ncbi:hypothetical protein HYH03_008588 [Edaphochlamys debaryana]|uniref:Protein kinase domain-containing protein n=1 Tax=Edaphochlamys debaryana TaxID=47281 RepID=A0A836BXV7_9CHLO|nr:hypothetical protein HYH03_008588 [Edaphochlamys debaryana]|eukprot:KAG2493166.1 hypothetical protein HYH03_008588 [Edaphochlamys debaryana]
MAGGVTLTLTQLILRDWRMGSNARTPGADIIANQAFPTASAPPVLQLYDMTLLYRFCSPADLSLGNAVGLPRPRSIPGNNSFIPGLKPSADCTNDTSAPLRERCWPQINYWQDFAFPGVYENSAGNLGPTGYLLHLRGVSTLCNDIMPPDCVQEYTSVGCELVQLAKPDDPLRPFPTSSGVPANQAVVEVRDLPSPPPYQRLGGDHPDHHDRGSEVHYVKAAAEEGASDDSASRTVGLAVGLAVGGFMALALAALAVFLVIRRRWQRSRSSSSDAFPGALSVGSTYPGDKASCADTDLEAGAQGNASFSSKAPPSQHTVGAFSLGLSSTRTGAATVTITTASAMAAASCALGTADSGLDAVLMDNTPLNPELPLSVRVMEGTHSVKGASDEAGEAEAGGQLTLPPQTNVLVEEACHVAEARAPAEAVALGPRLLGKGGFSRVYEGTYKGEPVAVKLLSAPWGTDCPSDEDWAGLRALLQSEVEVLGRVSHPNVVRLLAACVEPPRLALVMELCETSLERLIYDAGSGPRDADGLIPLPTVLHIGVQICQALSALHPTCMHRDLKPANVLLNNVSSPEPVAKITDFGLSRVRCATMRTQNPEAGTVQYLPPECFDLENEVLTCRLDIYSLGVLLWEALSGQQPWKGCSTVAVAWAVNIKGQRPPFDAIPGSRLPSKLRRLIDQCWDKDPLRRPAAAEAAKTLALVRAGVQGFESRETEHL